ncbi:IclR family transcriptional regulator C-terminal domain-containing protein [Streptomyces sp. FIT100]|uniref:IclR family transcriptional regulator domain-containing protein n=1 Tax=Streptomyces sp. FIT100 TaxID=2837956 RepID=UPI0021C60CE0|nr:IclR family transcriptional regulator C-terminal domain-containing protein [Streptomyces sp. FIT100]UUN25382.1 helix-turn-helix domain-containing protein [Streptomyces sp. FIT100]
MPAAPAAEPPAEAPAQAAAQALAEAPAEAVGPLMRGIAVLRAVSDAGGRMSLSDLVRTTGLARSTVDRVAATLARMGYVRLDGHEATLAPRLMELGNAYLAAAGLPGPLGPLAERLADELDESVSLAVPDADGIRFVHQTTRRRAMSLTFRIGDLLPAERTAPGPLFAAAWPDARWAAWRRGPGSGTADFEERAARAARDGWALDDQLIEPGLVALAVPVRDPRGRTVCALSVVSHTSRHGADALRRALLPRVRETVAAMERELHRAPPAAGQATAGEAAGGTAVRGLAHWTAASKQELGAEFVESLARGLTVITAFGEGRAELGLTAIAEATGLARATARRALITLEHLGYVTSQDRTFRLTPRVLALGCPPLSRTTLSDIAVPHMAELVRHVHDSASLAVLEGEDIRYTARVATERIMSVNITIGTRFPAYAASMGRVLLAGLPADERTAHIGRTGLRALTPRTVTDPARLAALLDRVVDEGYALVDEELEEGLRSLAVPVRNHTGRTVAALNVAMHSARRTLDECLTEVLPQLRATAAGIESDLRIAGRFTRIAEA